jgi:hypothetical protein
LVRIPAHQSWQSTIVLERCHRLLSVLGNCLAAHTNLAIQVVFQGLPDECDHAPETFYAVLSHNHRMKIEDLRRPILQIREVLSIASGCININQCFNLSICPQGTKTIDWDLAQDECDLEAILIPILLAFAGAKPSASALPTDLINSVVEPASEGSRYPWCPADEIRSVLHAGTIGVHSEFLINAETNLFLPRLLKARKLMVPETPGEAFRCRHLVQWGISKGRRKDLLRGLATVTGQAVWIAEDSFYRSIGLGIQREPGLGICLDDQTAHYDAKRPSRLETMLTSPWKISPQDQQRTRRIIDRITHSHISKYNQSPQQDIASRLSTTDAILVVDQRAGDQSIVSAGGSPKTFTAMLCEAIAIANGKRQIIVKTHPDANSGVKAAHYTPEMLAHFAHHDNITVLTDDVDPYCVFAACSDVLVCSSGLGFEALLAGKRVICHGLPFYAGWGLTRDHLRCVRRKIQRTIEEIFFLTILRYSLHIDPIRGHVVDFEHSLEYLLLARELFLNSKNRTQPGEG